jgi:hypothetical protein
MKRFRARTTGIRRRLAMPAALAALAIGTAPVLAAPSDGFSMAPKQLAAAPEEFLSGGLRPPDYTKVGNHSRSALIPVEFAPDARSGEMVWSAEFPMDAWSGARAVLVGPDSFHWEVAIETPETGRVTRSDAVAGRSGTAYQATEMGLEAASFPAEAFVFENAAPALWRAEIRAQAVHPRSGDRPHAYLLVGGETPYRLYTYFSTRDFIVGNRVELFAQLFDRDADPDAVGPGKKPAAGLPGAVAKVEATVYGPDGEAQLVPLFDDGGHNDGAMGDGLFGGALYLTEAGDFVAMVQAQGVTPAGHAFRRTSTHSFPVLEKNFAFQGTAEARVLADDDLRLMVDLPVSIQGEARKVRLAAEVWGRNAAGAEVPVCWLGCMDMPEARDGSHVVSLTLDSRWLTLAGATNSFELRNVRAFDPDANVPVDRTDSLSLTIATLPPALQGAAVSGVSEDMLSSALPASHNLPVSDAVLQAAARSAASPRVAPTGVVGAHNLFLSHGYCSGDTWWNPSGNGGRFVGGDFTGNAGWLEDYGQNRTHDQFAMQIRMATANFKSFGLIGHSQGGCASLHLWAFYYSGLDWARGGSRRIQSVGTPYQGTSLAGTLAAIGDIFGAGCGRNDNLTYDGAAAWLSGIPASNRSAINYFTTTFTDDFGLDWCHIATDILLDDPEDGTTENAYGQLPGATNRGLKEGWCHTFGMRDPGQTSDATRNADMRNNAMR